MEIFSGQTSPATLEYLLKRRSSKTELMGAPGPDAAQLENILKAATRVPDHGKLCPWYFLVFQDEARGQAGEIFAEIYRRKNPESRPDQITAETGRFLRAPLVIGVIARARRGKRPLWEQILSAGAACQNLSLAAHAQGFAVQWVTEWPAYDEDVKKLLGLDARDHVAGFIYIGTPTARPEERERPDLTQLVTYWSPDTALQKGDLYDVEKMGFPEAGFDFSKLKN